MKGVARWSAEELLNAFGTQYDHSQKTFELAAAGQRPPVWLEDAIREWALSRNFTDVTRNDSESEGVLYKPLLDPYEIRVLEIKPGAGPGMLRGSLHHCSLEFEYERKTWVVWDAEQSEDIDDYKPLTRHGLAIDDPIKPVFYTALSYTWGPQVFDGSIDCDGHVIAITKSLEAALHRFRREDRSIIMWIDQICIDQVNIAEKERQIPLMGKIYSRAWNTVIWLGESSFDSSSAMSLLEDADILLQMRLNDIDPADFERLGLPDSTSPSWHALYRFLSRPWFRRLWIIQEVILSKELFVACGDGTTTWRSLSNACAHIESCGISRWLLQQFSSTSDESSHPTDVFEAVLGIESSRAYHTGHPESTSLFGLLVSTRHAKCYDQRDKIYGLLAICSDSDREATRTSYAPDFSTSELYRDMTIHYLAADPGGLRLTTVLTSVECNSPDLPSWVPDWRKPRLSSSIGYSSSGQSIYNPNGPFLPGINKADCTYVKEYSNELHVRGISIDTIAQISDTFLDPELTYLSPSDNKALLDAWTFTSQLQEYPSPHTVFCSFCHTLVAGKDASGRARCPDSFAEIISLLLDTSTGQSPSLPGQTYSARQRLAAGRGKLEPANLASRTAGKTFLDVRAAMKSALRNRRLGHTEKGFLGLFPEGVRVGDEVYVLDGCHVLFVTRGVDGELKLRTRLVGECYVYGVMDGEALVGEKGLQDIVLT